MPMRGLPKHASQHIEGGVDEINQELALAAIPDDVSRNLARGITPTIFGTGFVPAHLERVTDGDLSTSSDLGWTISTDPELQGIEIDLGRPYLVHDINFVVGMYIADPAQTARSRIYISEDGVNWESDGTITTFSTTEEIIASNYATTRFEDFALVRYVRLGVASSDAGYVASFLIYEITVLGVNY